MKLKLLTLALLSFATHSYAGCERYFITYVENETDLSGKAREVILGLQKEDYKAIFKNASKPVSSGCQFFINGFDLAKDKNGESKLVRIYDKIVYDNSDAPVDLVTLTHGAGDGKIEILGGRSISLEEAFFNDMPPRLKKRLGVFADFACYGFGSKNAAIKAGFAAAIGISVESLGPLLARDFFTNYLEGKTLRETAEELNYNCQNDAFYKTISKAVSDDHKQYCKDAALKILGNPEITVDHTTNDMKNMKAETAKSTEPHTYFANEQRRAPIITKATGTYQTGDNSVNQVDLYTRNPFFTRFSVTTNGDFGYQFGLVNQPHGKILSFERDPKNNVRFAFTAFSFDKSIYSTGRDYDNGLSWKYNLSAEVKAGYLRIEDANGDDHKLANVGAKINNELRVGYRALKLETNAGRDYLVLHNSNYNYANGSISIRKGDSSVGAYASYNSLTGKQAGVQASISIKDLTKKRKKKK